MKNRILENIEKSKKIEVDDIVSFTDEQGFEYPTCLIIKDKFNERYPYKLLDLDTSNTIEAYPSINKLNNDVNVKLVCKGEEIEIKRVD